MKQTPWDYSLAQSGGQGGGDQTGQGDGGPQEEDTEPRDLQAHTWEGQGQDTCYWTLNKT